MYNARGSPSLPSAISATHDYHNSRCSPDEIPQAAVLIKTAHPVRHMTVVMPQCMSSRPFIATVLWTVLMGTGTQPHNPTHLATVGRTRRQVGTFQR